MKTILSVLLVLITTLAAFAQSKPTCCSMTATQEFSMLTADASFSASHAEPLPYTYTDDIGQMVQFKTPDGQKTAAFEIRSAYNNEKWLFVFHEWWGLNDHIKKEAVKYFKSLKDVNILVLDLYDGKIATTREEAGKLMGNADETRIRNIIAGALKHVGKQASVATVGWCFGGGWSLQAAGAVVYYGMPEKDVEQLKTLTAPVLFMFAQKDDWINQEVVTQFEADMKTADKTLIVKTYDAVHAFANPSNPNYDKVAADDAYEASLKFIRTQLNRKGG